MDDFVLNKDEIFGGLAARIVESSDGLRNRIAFLLTQNEKKLLDKTYYNRLSHFTIDLLPYIAKKLGQEIGSEDAARIISDHTGSVISYTAPPPKIVIKEPYLAQPYANVHQVTD